MFLALNRLSVPRSIAIAILEFQVRSSTTGKSVARFLYLALVRMKEEASI